MATSPFVAILLYRFTSTSPTYEPLYREDVVLLYAEDVEGARAKALATAQQEVGPSENEFGQVIDLELLDVIDVAPALDDDLSDGGDLYARHFRDLAAYRRVDSPEF